MVTILLVKRERLSVEAADFSIEKSFNMLDDTEIEEMYDILRQHDHAARGTSFEIQCHEDDEHWFSSERLIMPSLDRFPEMVDLARDIVTHSRRFNVQCWLRLKMW